MRRWLLLVFIFFVSVGYLQAAIITVDDDGPAQYSKIQDAINAAVGGDIVLVKDGIYAGTGNRDLDFNGRNITVMSENGPDSCIIDCQGSEIEPHRGFYFNSGENSDATLDGFTIKNGWVPLEYPNFYGGGIYCENSSPTIRNCVFVNNFGGEGGGGGGVCVKNSGSTIFNCAFLNNSADVFGGAIYCYSNSDIIIKNCFIAESSSRQGDISCFVTVHRFF